MATNYQVQVDQPKGVKVIRLSYLNSSKPDKMAIPELRSCLLLETNTGHRQTEEIWIHQPYRGQFELSYQNHDYFNVLEYAVKKARQTNGYQGMVTASLFAKNDQIIDYQTQDLSKHHLNLPTDPTWWELLQTKYQVDETTLEKIKRELPDILKQSGLDVREGLKKFVNIPSGTGYDLNPGSSPDNHSEGVTLYDFFGVSSEPELDQALANPTNQDKIEALQGSTCYLYGHWWSCEDCGRKMAKVGVKKVVLSLQWVKNHIGL